MLVKAPENALHYKEECNGEDDTEDDNSYHQKSPAICWSFSY